MNCSVLPHVASYPEVRQIRNFACRCFSISSWPLSWSHSGPHYGSIYPQKEVKRFEKMKRGKVPQGQRGAIYCSTHTKKSKKFSISFDYFVWQRYYNVISTHNLNLCSYRESKSIKSFFTALTPPPFLDPALVGVFFGIFRFNQKNP